MDFYSEMLELVVNGKIKTKAEIHNAKIEMCRKYNLPRVPSDTDILEFASEEIYELVEPILRLKPMRTISGVAPVAVMTSPEKCPHGTCAYCPGGVEFGSAQSYTGFEPASRRATANEFDPFLQTRSRLEQLNAIGHHTDKIDLIIMGGTFTARPQEYQDWFIKGCFNALNGHDKFEEQSELNELQNENETAAHRCIGMTIETRPDWCKKPEIDQVLRLGGTRVELGVQTVYDDVLTNVSRGHTVQDSIRATQLLKDSGFKVCYHLMPGLPGSSITRDREMFERVFTDQAFMPDMLKIYPTLIIKDTELYKKWVEHDYEPLTTDSAVDLIMNLKTQLPPWVRIQRIQRDIPIQYIEAGVDKSNLRQLVNQKLESQGKKCNCIRCREVGHLSLRGIEPEGENIKLNNIEYRASGGDEVFMSYEDSQNNILISFVRLRLPSPDTYREEFFGEKKLIGSVSKPQTAIIRELKVFGPMVPLDEQAVNMSNSKYENEGSTKEWQHRGYGQLLLEASEKFAKEHWDCSKLLIMSGVGVKPYYARFGYHKKGAYMTKEL
jgi:elongator complex protein 3